jgi:hypothetical protein
MIGDRFERFWMVPLPPANIPCHLCGPKHSKPKVLLDRFRCVNTLKLFQRTTNDRELFLRIKIFPKLEAVPSEVSGFDSFRD